MEKTNEDFKYTLAGWSEAFAIMGKYSDATFQVCAEHDEIFAGNEIDMESISPEDMKRMEELGWMVNESDGGFHRFT